MFFIASYSTDEALKGFIERSKIYNFTEFRVLNRSRILSFTKLRCVEDSKLMSSCFCRN